MGFLNGLTATQPLCNAEGIKDIDGTIVKLSKMVPVLMIEALGSTAEEILKETERQLQKALIMKLPFSAAHLLRLTESI